MTVSVRIRAVMKIKGYVPAAVIARTTGYTASAVRRWADEGKIEAVAAGGEVFVLYTSLVAHLGAETCSALGVDKLNPQLTATETQE